MHQRADDTARVIGPPPIIAIGVLGLGLAPHFLWQAIHLFPEWWLGFVFGWPLLTMGLAVLTWAFLTMAAAGEDVRVEKPTNKIVASGPYAWTRNPIYLAMVVGYVSISLILNSAWPLFILPVMIAVMQYGVILREESYLQLRFGSEYASYKARVRRWI